jgi:hypothetical protein
VDNIKMDLSVKVCGGIVLTDVAQDGEQWRALVNTVMNLRVPQNVAKFLTSCTTCSFSRRAQILQVSYMMSKFKFISVGTRNLF